jgi:hypothetical protein
MNDEHIVYAPRIKTVVDVIADARARRMRVTNPAPSPMEAGEGSRANDGAEQEAAGEKSTGNRQR